MQPNYDSEDTSKLVSSLSQAVQIASSVMKSRKSYIYVSYSFRDQEEKNVLLLYLRVLHQLGVTEEIWDRSQTKIGTEWTSAISWVINQSRVAILLISDNYLNSDYLLASEIPKLLEQQQTRGLVIFPIIIRPCAWYKTHWLGKLQVVPRTGKPIWNDCEEDKVHEKLVDVIIELAKILGVDDSKLHNIISGDNRRFVKATNLIDPKKVNREDRIEIWGDLTIGGNAILSPSMLVRGDVTIGGNSYSGYEVNELSETGDALRERFSKISLINNVDFRKREETAIKHPVSIRLGHNKVLASGTVIAVAGEPIEITVGSEQIRFIFIFSDQRKYVSDPIKIESLNDETIEITLPNIENSSMPIGTTHPLPLGVLNGRSLYCHYRVRTFPQSDSTLEYTIYQGDRLVERW